MKTRIVYGRNGKNRYYIGDREVTRAEYDAISPNKLKDLFASCQVPGGHHAAGWPMVSDSMMIVTDRQKREIVANARAKGVRLELDSEGRPILESRGHRKEVARFFGMSDWDAGYGDPVGDKITEAM